MSREGTVNIWVEGCQGWRKSKEEINACREGGLEVRREDAEDRVRWK